MIAFPKSIKNGDIELVKFEPTFENATKVFNLLDGNREFIDEYINRFEKIKKLEDEFNWIIIWTG